MDNLDSKELEENNETNMNSENPSSIESPKNLDNNDDKKPFFLMTLEDNLGKCQQIKIYQNSNPSELAFNFCKENNLDFSSMKYIKANIKAIIRKFNDTQQKGLLYNNNNNSIKEEEDEDDYLTERTMKSNEKQKNKNNDEENKLNEEEKKNKELNDINNNNNEENNSNEENDKNENRSVNKENNNEENNDDNNCDNIENINGNKESIKNDEKDNNNIDEIDKSNKSMKLVDKENKNEVIKNFNNLGMMPLKINQISPKQIEINENIQKIIKSNNNSINSENDSINNFKSLKTADINNKQNSNFINTNTNNTTDRYSNSVQITIVDNKEIKDVKEISNSLQSKLKTKLSDIKQNKYIEQPFKSAEKKDIRKNKNLINENNNNELKNNFDLNNFGEKYINLNKDFVNKNNNDFSNNLNQSEDSIESGVPVLHNDNDDDKDDNINEKEKEKENYGNCYTNNNSEQTNYNSTAYKKEVIKKKDTKKKINNSSSNYINKHGNNMNKLMLLNKMKKLEYNIPKKNSSKNKQIDKLFNLIKNSYYKMNKNNKNNKHFNNSKIIKDKNVESNKIKIKESNSIDINNELSRTYETEPNKNYPKEVINNPNIENSHKKINFINTNFNNYIENNKINHIKNNVSASNNEAHQMNLTNSINKQYFFSNPNLSSNQEVVNKSNNIYCHKHTFKNNSKKKKFATKSKSLGKDKNNKNSKINSHSKHKNQNQLSKKHNENNNNIINNKIKPKDLIKEKKKRCSLKFKNKYYLNNNSATPNINGEKKARYLNLQSCQTPPTKKPVSSNNYMNSIFSDWIMLTLGKGSRNIFSTRDTYFPKNRENNQTSKSVSELADNHKKKSNYRMLLSKSNFKNAKPNIIVRKIKYAMRNKNSMEKNNINNKNHNQYLNSLKMINNSEAIWNKNNKNNFNLSNNNNNNNESHNHVIHKKSTDRNNIMNNKRYLDRVNYNNNNVFNNNSMNANNIINDYNFNNNNYYLSRLINNTINNFIYDSNENSKSGEKIRKIIQKQLTSPPKAMNYSKEFFGNKCRKKSSDKIIEYKTAMNKIGKMILNNSGQNQSYTTDNIPNSNQNININNLININNYQKNKNYNFNYDYNTTNAACGNGNNHYIKNSKLKKNKVGNNHKINDNNQYCNIDRSRKQIDFANELTNYYLNTEIFKQNYTNTNMTYSNLMNNTRTLSIDFSTDDKMLDEILINIFNKIFIFFNKEKTNKITLLDAFYKAKINFFPRNIGKILNNMILILSKNYSKKKKASHASYNSLVNTTKNSIDSIIVIDKNDFINEMLYIYKYYLSNEHKKVIISYKDNFNKINQDNFLDRSFCNIPKNNIKNEFASPKSLHIKPQYKNKTEIKNNGKIKPD